MSGSQFGFHSLPKPSELIIITGTHKVLCSPVMAMNAFRGSRSPASRSLPLFPLPWKLAPLQIIFRGRTQPQTALFNGCAEEERERKSARLRGKRINTRSESARTRGGGASENEDREAREVRRRAVPADGTRPENEGAATSAQRATPSKQQQQWERG